MTNKVYYTDKQIDTMIHGIIRQMVKDNWVPDYVVGITRGGLIPAIKISQYLSVPMETLKVSLRDGGECESNCWMAEEASGWQMDSPKKILIVDDINDTGATLNWIKNDWESSVRLDEREWEKVWNESVRFASLIDNDASPFQINYVGESINKAENEVWVVFPWENWWHGS